MLLRHKSHNEDENGSSSSTIKGRISINATIKDKIKSAAANLVSMDLRPFTILQGKGMIDVCQACMEFGQKYNKATREDLLKVLPCPKTVKMKINQRATENVAKISNLIKQAIRRTRSNN